MVECKVEKSNVFLSSKAGVMIPVEVRVDSSMWLEVKRLKIPNGKQKPSIKTVQKRKGHNKSSNRTDPTSGAGTVYTLGATKFTTWFLVELIVLNLFFLYSVLTTIVLSFPFLNCFDWRLLFTIWYFPTLLTKWFKSRKSKWRDCDYGKRDILRKVLFDICTISGQALEGLSTKERS
jgi:hypothetical protein